MIKMNDVVSIKVNDIVVPEYVHYIGDWKEYNLKNYPFPHILNKVLTGCGYTEDCLRNLQNLILLSPRKFLLENKKDQHIDDINIFYAENNIEKIIDYELDISKETKSLTVDKDETDEEIERKRQSIKILQNRISEHWEFCRGRKLPCKILVTYDSFRHVIEALGEDIREFQIVIDEFQSIFIDARFKSETEIEFVNHLKAIQEKYKIQRICYVSATPMLENYLIQLDEFKDLPYYRFDWSSENPGRVKKPKLDIKQTTRSLSESVNQIIGKYKKEEFETCIITDVDGKLKKVVSNEAVLFFNSVKGISQAIRTNKLLPPECNILCANTPENERRIREAFNDVIKFKQEENSEFKMDLIKRGTKTIGKIPTQGEPRKMFTFCTRTVYLGADFYSECARTFIFSDSNVDCLSVDISLDLEQILGRQRLDENPWKNMATLYVKTTKDKKKLGKEDFQKILDKKVNKSNTVLEGYESVSATSKHAIAEKLLISARAEHYKNDYVAVNRHGGSDLKPVFNKLMMLSELRAFEVQQEDYADRFTVLSSLENQGVEISGSKRVNEFINKYNEIKLLREKIKALSDFYFSCNGDNIEDWTNLLEQVDPKFKQYFTILGPERVRANGYLAADIEREMQTVLTGNRISDQLKAEIYDAFKVGNKYSSPFIKEKLKEIYDKLGYNGTSKATQLKQYFSVKSTKVKSGGEWLNGFEILEVIKK